MEHKNFHQSSPPKDVQIALGMPDSQINQVYRLFKKQEVSFRKNRQVST